MRKIILLLATGLIAFSSYGQKTKVASKAQLEKTSSYDVKLRQMLKNVDNGPMVGSNKVAPLDHGVKPGNGALAASATTPLKIGRASNVYSHLRQEQNNVYADNDLGLVLYVHRQDVSIHGGGGSANGKLRYDISIDAGVSFSSDIGILNATYTRPARYPNITGFNPDSTNTDPLQSDYFFVAPSLDPTPDWDGHVSGTGTLVNSGTTTNTEHYDFLGDNSLLPGGLTEGRDGEFWATDITYSGTDDTIYVYKGTYTGTDVTWTRSHKLMPAHNVDLGAPTVVGPNIAFSPDGNTGWIAWLGDLVGGHDSLLSPCFYKSSDGGATWDTAAVEVDLRQFSWISDSLTTFWINVDSLTGDTTSAGSGRPTTGFDFDLTVDMNGNPHLVAIIGNGTAPGGDPPGYSILSGINKFVIDVYSTDGGTTWGADYIAPILAFRGDFGIPDAQGDLLSMDNVCQASRTADGTRVFFSWVDSDTSVIGFGESDNLAPNLRIASKRITDGQRTCWKRISDGDQIWDGKILYPQMAPEVLTAPSGNRHYLPIVFFEMVNNDQLGPTQFYYIGNDAQILESDYADPATLNLAFDAVCYPVFVGNEEVQPKAISINSFPNPTSGNATLRLDLVNSENVQVDLMNLYGQKVMTIANGTYAAGRHDIQVNTAELASGVYIYSLKAGDKYFTTKMIVNK